MWTFLGLVSALTLIIAFLHFLTIRKVHRRLPRRIRLPFSRRLQAGIGQRVTA